MTATQLSLFAPALRPVGYTGRPPIVDRIWERAFSPEVEAEILATVAARPDEWLGWNAFRAIIDKHGIGSCLGHVLGRMVRTGLIQEKRIYCGKGLEADRPGSPDYMGFYNEWKAMEAACRST